MTGVVVDPGRAVVRVAGPDATTFLQGQCSQDLAALPPGRSAWSWVLQPTGKVDALVRATRIGADEWLLDTDAGHTDALVARLLRFRLRTKADVEALDWPVAGVRGAVVAGPGVVADASWGGVEGVDLLGASVAEVARATGFAVVDDSERRRIEAGFPRMGAELTDRTIPGETGLIDVTVSFTKGCYTGQELVARIDSRGGNVPRHLRRLRLDAAVEPGSEGDGVTVTSVAADPAGGYVALGYVRRSVDPEAELTVGAARVEVRSP